MRFREINSQQGAELELAPMIDVVFLLLIFFIVSWQSARFERDMDISVPSAEEAENKDRQAGEIIINVRKDGTVILNGLEVTEEQLLAKLVAVSEAFP
ncbi:MAG TPA: biopolymer transporter ExbD, partial [Verrucomicrobiales bacterium]|nr:biopolymer transporter ExbD [Verrucomicrobiales bacterium]